MHHLYWPWIHQRVTRQYQSPPRLFTYILVVACLLSLPHHRKPVNPVSPRFPSFLTYTATFLCHVHSNGVYQSTRPASVGLPKITFSHVCFYDFSSTRTFHLISNFRWKLLIFSITLNQHEISIHVIFLFFRRLCANLNYGYSNITSQNQTRF